METNELGYLLYVDDEETNLSLFKFAFGRRCNIITANSGEKGLLALKSNNIKLIISDMKMPGMNGIEFIKKAKEIRSDIPCVILSGYLKDNETDEMIKSGYLLDYLMKPYDKEQIIKLIALNIKPIQ